MEPAEFATPSELNYCLEDNHSQVEKLWVRIFKKDASKASVTWQDCVVAAIAWGWIDGQKKPLDDVSYLQRLTPRREKSNWSQKNKEHAEKLIAAGKMSAAGLQQVEEAKSDGRWDAAYAGQAKMEILPISWRPWNSILSPRNSSKLWIGRSFTQSTTD